MNYARRTKRRQGTGAKGMVNGKFFHFLERFYSKMQKTVSFLWDCHFVSVERVLN
jgi:hypothetical protein